MTQFRRHRSLVGWALLPVMLFNVTTMAGEPDEFHWSRQLEIPSITTTTLVSVTLDSHFFENTRSGRPDVRLRNRQGDQIGFRIRAARDTHERLTRKTWTAHQTKVQVDQESGLKVDMELRREEPAPTAIRLITPLRDFEHQVRIESSSDGNSWSPAS
ncbi:MAG: hypothetical protein FJ267_16565, partial [Planctomycetes bacterium]|nr:hypothetical protein [Planctomycetota bacterium]